MQQTVEREIRGGICHAIYRYAKATNKYMKDTIKKMFIINVLGCEQFIRMGKVSKIIC